MRGLVVPLLVALASAACVHEAHRMTVGEALRRAPALDGEELQLQGFVVTTRHSLGLVDSCDNRREIGLAIPPGLESDPEGAKLLQAIYGRHPMSFWTGSHVILQGRLQLRDTDKSPEFVLEKVLEHVRTTSKCDPPNYAPS